LPNTFSCLNRRQNQIIATVAWHDQIFIYERGKPLSRLLLDWFNGQDVQIIHTGLVARNNQGLLFVGKSGAGKSTSSLACVNAGFGYLSEDYVGLQLCEDGSFVGHSLYNSLFLRTEHLDRFPQLAPYAIRGRMPYEEKSVILLSQVFPERLQRVVPIRALILPRIVNARETWFRRASKGEALLALGPTSLLQIPNRGLGVRGFNNLAYLVERIPCFWLEVGTDLTSIPRCLENLFVKFAVQ
jgi:serine kinase of HPr protein (carbohydrate metabolism regulator)